MTHVTIVGLFDNRADADRALDRLQREFGVSTAAMMLHQGGATPRAAAAPSLLLSALPAAERDLYHEGLRRGGVPVSVEAERGAAAGVMVVFAECNAADLDAREAAWRAEGWAEGPRDTGYTGHDEDIGFATYGGDAVIRRIPRDHVDDTPAGLLGRLEMAAMQDAPSAAAARHARAYVLHGQDAGRTG